MFSNEATLSRLHQDWLEQPEPTPIAVDYKGDHLYYGDLAFRTVDGMVRDEDVYEYMEYKYGKTIELDDAPF